jgi:lipid-A-disaccharide synthase
MARIGIVAGESSGDRLGAGLIKELYKRRSDLAIEGVAGPSMVEAGCKALYPMDRLAVMGIVEVLGRYRGLLGLRKKLVAHFLADPPDLFIGIDAPEFNLELEEQLHQAGIPTVHYVGPQVWAWREGRLAKIARAVDLMLVLFPFEETYYRRHAIPVRFVGHPLADEIPLDTDRFRLRTDLGLPVSKTIMALLPGSRANEWRYHVEPFIRTALWLTHRHPGLHFAIPLVSPESRNLVQGMLDRIGPDLPVSLYDGRSREVLGAADVVLTVSGTASLESLLLKRPMVVVYRMGWLSYAIARLMVRLPYFSLPNLLAGRRIIPELLQSDVQPEKLGQAILHWLAHPEAVIALQREFTELHRSLRRNASSRAAEAVLELLERDPCRNCKTYL